MLSSSHRRLGSLRTDTGDAERAPSLERVVAPAKRRRPRRARAGRTVDARARRRSATWSGVYNDWKSLSGSYVRTTECNNFCAKQTFDQIEVETLEAGYQVNAAGACSSVLGGYYNDACGGGSAVVAGNNNDVFGNFATIAAGENNVITSAGTSGFIAGGGENCVRHPNAVAMGTCT